MISEKDITSITNKCTHFVKINTELKSYAQTNLLTEITKEAKKMLASQNSILVTIHKIK